MKEQHRLAVCAGSRRAIAQHLGATSCQRGSSGADVRNFKTDMVHAAGRILGKESSDGGAFAQRFEQLDLGIAGIDKDHCDAVFGEALGLADLGTEQVAVFGRGRGEIGYGDGDVVEAADHLLLNLPSIWLKTENAALRTFVPGPKMPATPAS